MAKNNYGAIVEIEGSDLISESMYKINENFKILAEKEEQDEYKWESYANEIAARIEDLIANNESMRVIISRDIKNLADKIEQFEVSDAKINSVNDKISAIESRLDDIESRLDDIENKLDNLTPSENPE